MKKLAKYFLNGIVTVLPIILVIYVVIKVFEFLDSLLGYSFKKILEEDYVPGLGIFASIILITFLGWLSKLYISGKLVKILDQILERIPLVKSVYSIIKDTIESIVGENRSFSKVALAYVPNTNMKMIGFLTSEEVETLANPLKDHVAIYVPQSFQVAGLTFLIPKKDVEILDVRPEDAMKFVMSGGMAKQRKM